MPEAHNPALLFMRTLALLLLLLSLPGLLVPAGFALHWCHCGDPATTANAQASCCAAEPERTPESAPRRCCHGGCCGTTAATGPDGGEDAHESGTPCDGHCTCTTLLTPGHKPDPMAPGHAGMPPMALPAAGVAPIFLPIHFAASWHTTATRPPPPDRERTLPLLL